jgi:hypothetical protein
LKWECHSKTAVRLKEQSPEASRSIKGFSSRFTKLQAQLNADTLLDFANETEVEKALV